MNKNKLFSLLQLFRSYIITYFDDLFLYIPIDIIVDSELSIFFYKFSNLD